MEKPLKDDGLSFIIAVPLLHHLVFFVSISSSHPLSSCLVLLSFHIYSISLWLPAKQIIS